LPDRYFRKKEDKVFREHANHDFRLIVDEDSLAGDVTVRFELRAPQAICDDGALETAGFIARSKNTPQGRPVAQCLKEVGRDASAHIADQAVRNADHDLAPRVPGYRFGGPASLRPLAGVAKEIFFVVLGKTALEREIRQPVRMRKRQGTEPGANRGRET